MPVANAENLFSMGLAALVENRPVEAAEHFREAMRIEKREGTDRFVLRYLSYYGLAMARGTRAMPEAIKACELAVNRDPSSPALLLNLGRVYLMGGRLARGLQCLERALELAPAHPAVRKELARVERRKPPCIAMLNRAHPVNRVLGKLRAAVTHPKPAAPTQSRAEASP